MLRNSRWFRERDINSLINAIEKKFQSFKWIERVVPADTADMICKSHGSSRPSRP